MSFEGLFNGQQEPSGETAPRRSNQDVQNARRRARRAAAASGRRSTLLGGRSGGGETIARKSLLGE